MAESDQAEQKPLEEQVHVFVLKLWLETDPPRMPFWRGHITHLPSNDRVSVQQFAQLHAFIQRYLQLPD